MKEPAFYPVVAHCQFSPLGRDLACPLCGAKVLSGQGHACSVHKSGRVSSRNGPLAYACIRCLMRFETVGELNSHIEGCKSWFELTTQSETSGLPSSLGDIPVQPSVRHERPATRHTPKRPSLSVLDGERN